jgi:hypothetical protein
MFSNESLPVGSSLGVSDYEKSTCEDSEGIESFNDALFSKFDFCELQSDHFGVAIFLRLLARMFLRVYLT